MGFPDTYSDAELNEIGEVVTPFTSALAEKIEDEGPQAVKTLVSLSVGPEGLRV